MKIAAPYSLKKERREKIDEYNIDFDSEKHKIEDLTIWIKNKELKNKRINLRMVNKPIALDKLIILNSLYNNLYIRLQDKQESLIDNFKKNDIKFFFDYIFNINSFCRLKNVIDQGTTDVYITEDLCYRLPQVKRICNNNNVQMRLIVNRIPSFTVGKESDLTMPFYVPENIEKLEKYYDIIEFELFNSWNRFDTLYKIWFIDKEWKEDLTYINYELEKKIPGKTFPREICEYKMNCGHRCVERQSSCNKCEQAVWLARTMEEKGSEYTIDQKWVENGKEEVIENIFN